MINILAYIDPGSTAFVLQVLAGIMIVFGVVLTIWWTKITTFFKGLFTKLFGGKDAENKGTDEAIDEIIDDETTDTSSETDDTADEITDTTDDTIDAASDNATN